MTDSAAFSLPRLVRSVLLLAAVVLNGCRIEVPPANTTPGAATEPSAPEMLFPIMLGIDVLAEQQFAPLRGKRVGLLTHPAGVNRHGESTISVLHRAPEVNLVALFGPEHGLYGGEKANIHISDTTDPRTGLPVYSLYGATTRPPTAEQLRGLDVMVVDLQDIGVRSYTFNVVLRYTIDACFLHGVEVMVLDRPNPLGGLKADGPILERPLYSGVGAYPIPYVHGLTIGELARFAAATPGVLDVPEAVRARGRLTVVPMRGWRRELLWPETGLTFAPTSQYIRDFAAVVGYAMIGLGCEYSGFTHGLESPHPFRALSFPNVPPEQLEGDLRRLLLPGVGFRQVTWTPPFGKTRTAVFVDVTDWESWNPTELSFHMMRLACVYTQNNPFAKLPASQKRLFNVHVGSTAWWEALTRDGSQVDVADFVRQWQEEARAYHRRTEPHWLYR